MVFDASIVVILGVSNEEGLKAGRALEILVRYWFLNGLLITWIQ